MTLPRPLARLVAVVIVMIAAAFGASVAQAHEGHAHHAIPAVAADHQITPTPVTEQAVAVAFNQAAAATPTDRLLSAAAPRAAVPSDGEPCHGVCCSMGSSCCVSGAMLPAGVAALPVSTAAVRLIAVTEPFLAGIPREALPKPPRSFA